MRCSVGGASRSPATGAPASVAPTSLRAFSIASAASVPSRPYLRSVNVPLNSSSFVGPVPSGATAYSVCTHGCQACAR